MRAHTRLPFARPSAPKHGQRGALGIFQLLGLGLLLMIVLFVLIVAIRGLFT